MTGRAADGFTLVELLVVLTLLSLLTAGLMGVVRFGGGAMERTLAAGADSQRIESVHRLLRGLLSRAGEDAGAALPLAGDDATLSLATAMPTHLAASGRAQVDLRVARTDGGLALELAWRTDYPRPLAAVPAVRTTLAEGLAEARFAYFGAAAAEGAPAWRGAWTDTARLPDLVKVTVRGGDGRAWPDLVVALPAARAREALAP